MHRVTHAWTNHTCHLQLLHTRSNRKSWKQVKSLLTVADSREDIIMSSIPGVKKQNNTRACPNLEQGSNPKGLHASKHSKHDITGVRQTALIPPWRVLTLTPARALRHSDVVYVEVVKQKQIINNNSHTRKPLTHGMHLSMYSCICRLHRVTLMLSLGTLGHNKNNRPHD